MLYAFGIGGLGCRVQSGMLRERLHGKSCGFVFKHLVRCLWSHESHDAHLSEILHRLRRQECFSLNAPFLTAGVTSSPQGGQFG